MSLSFSWRSCDPIYNPFKDKTFHMPFYAAAVSESSIPASSIWMRSISLLFSRRFIEINLQNALWFVAALYDSPSTTCLVNLVFLYFYASATVVLLVQLACVWSFIETQFFCLCLSPWFSIIKGLLNKNVTLVSDRAYVPSLFLLWFSITMVRKFLE